MKREHRSQPKTVKQRGRSLSIQAIWMIVALGLGAPDGKPALGASIIVDAAHDWRPPFEEPVTAYLVPFVAVLKEGDPDDNSPEILRSGWSTSLGLFNPADTPQEYRFSYYDRSGRPVVTYRTRPIPAHQNLFTTPEVMACVMRSPKNPSEECRPEATYILEDGDPRPLVERTFVGYVLIEDVDRSDPFLTSAWAARGGVDLVNPECRAGHCEFISFGYNRAAFDIPVIPIGTSGPETTESLLFSGISLIPQSRMQRRGSDPVRLDTCEDRRGELCIPSLRENQELPGRPNGATAAIVTINLGPSDVRARLTFTPSGAMIESATSQPFRLRNRAQAVLLLSQFLGSDLGSGTVRLDVLEGESLLAGMAFQSDRFFQFFGYGIQGKTLQKDSQQAPQKVSRAARDFVVPYALRTVGSEGFDSRLSIFNSGPFCTVSITYVNNRGAYLARDEVNLEAGISWSSPISQLSAPEGFVGWIRIQASSPVLVEAQVARGGSDPGLYGWQSFAFRAPVILTAEVTATERIGFLAMNESRGAADAPPPIAPYELEDIQHVNGFDIGVVVTNLDDTEVSFRLSFLRRYVSGNADDLLISRNLHTIRPGESRGLSAAQDFRDAKPLWLDDGMMIVEVIDSKTLEARKGRIVAAAVQSDRSFKYFSYGVTGHRLP